MRRPIFAANWKMHKTLSEAAAFTQEFLPLVAPREGVDIVLCPPFTALGAVAWSVAGSRVALGAQNMYRETHGAFTGEVSPVMLADIGCRYVILGHSERRQYFGERDDLINQKVKAAFAHGLTPILCVGETLAEREEGRTEAVCRSQALACTEGLSAEQAATLVIAYEPVWAIGTGRNCAAADAQATVALIRSLLAGRFGESAAASLRIQYGGSVKPGNTAEYMALPDVDGALVGGASLEAVSFAAICQAGAVR
jgi:triosephosphate isomerase (TIM)